MHRNASFVRHGTISALSKGANRHERITIPNIRANATITFVLVIDIRRYENLSTVQNDVLCSYTVCRLWILGNAHEIRRIQHADAWDQRFSTFFIADI